MNTWMYYQNQEYLEMTRIMLMNRELLPYTAQKLGLEAGMEVLDVGCGTGEYTFYLSGGVAGAAFTGIDAEEAFIEKAAETAAGRKDNRFHFLTGDARRLPFADGSFDLVVSQTFLTALADYEAAAEEMRRVCRPGGLIASVTPAEIVHPCYTPGRWPFYFGWKKRYDALVSRLQSAYEKYAPFAGSMPGIAPMEVPQLFVKLALHEVSAYPVASLFSLSNAAVPDSVKRRYIELGYLSEVKKLRFFSQNVAGFTEDFSPAEAEEFEKLCALKRQTLIAAIGENRIWEWQYAPMVLVTGRKDGGRDG